MGRCSESRPGAVENDPKSEASEQGQYELEPDLEAGLRGRARLAAEAIAAAYIGFIAITASATGIYFIMFPELGALSFDVFGRPRGRWSNSPVLLATTPALTAIVGILVTRNLPYGFLSVMITVAGQPDRHPVGFAWVVALLLFVFIAEAVVKLTGLRFVLFPPLVVIAYEMFAHRASCGWADEPFRLPVACFAASLGGFGFWYLFGANPIAAVCSMGLGIGVLRVTRVHVAPALAVALLPMVMEAPTLAYPFAVGLGTLMLTLWFYLFERVFGAYVSV